MSHPDTPFDAIPVNERPPTAASPLGSTVSPERLREERIKAAQTELQRRDRIDAAKAEIARRDALITEDEPTAEEAPPLALQAAQQVKSIAGLPEAALTIGSGALAGVINIGLGVGGVIDAVISAVPGGITVNESLDRTASAMKSVGDALTFVPRTAAGKTALETIAAPIVLLDGAAQSVARVGANSFGMQDNKYVATAIYTALIAIPELLGLKGARNLKVTQRTMSENVKKVKEVAKDLDLDLKQDALSASVVESAKAMSPIIRAENAEALRASLKEAREASAFDVDVRVQQAQSLNAQVNVKNTTDFAAATLVKLQNNKYSVQSMPIVQSRLKELAAIGKESPITGKRKVPSEDASLIELPPHIKTSIDKGAKVTDVDLMDVQTIIHKLEQDIKKTGTPGKTHGVAKTSRQDLALTTIKKDLEGFLDGQYVDDMISGDSSAVLKWQTAGEARAAHQARWTADKDIAHLIEKGATPEQVHAYLLGNSVTSPKKNAVSVIRRLKDVLGKDHPAFIGIRQDFLYEIIKPILVGDARTATRQNFKKFADVYDFNVKNNSRLMTELGIDQTSLKQLRDFARIAQELPTNSRLAAMIEFIPNAIAKMGFGHGIAKAGLKVNVASNVFKILLGRDRVSRKQILMEAANASFGTPILDKASINAGRIVQAVILGDLSEDRAQ